MSRTEIFERLEILVGRLALRHLGETRAILFGVGGVGSWCAEALIRNGIGDLTLVDSDVVCATNINRQLQATTATVDMGKVDVLSLRLREINPDATVTPVEIKYDRSTRNGFDLSTYDYVIDAIDSLGNKVDLIEQALASETTLFSALGASAKLDPTRVRSGSFWEVRGCPLGKHLRKRVRNRGVTTDFKCVYSDENLPRFEPEDQPNRELHDQVEGARQINGSSAHITGIFGFHLAGLVTGDVVSQTSELE